MLIKEKDLDVLPDETQKIGEQYINRPDVKNKLQDLFKQHVLPALSKPVLVYDGKGITLDDIQFVLNERDKESQSQAQKLFHTYENKRKISINKANDWLQKLENDNKTAYPYVKKLIHEKYNN